MGLLYTKLYLDFEASNWKEVSHNPTIFEAIADGVTIEVYDTSQISRKLTFRKGGKIQVFRVVGKFRLNWADEDIV
jgi:hypothetical protein